jgi:cyclophilin family peptidyl-prolyl cis-trans isomerase
VKPAILLTLLISLVAAGCGGDDDNSTPGPSATSCDVDIQDPAHAPNLQPLGRGKTYRIEFKTSHGAFTVELDPAKAPCNGASLMDLAETGFFDDTRFHRIVPGFVIQGGDPTATGNGGAGYTTQDQVPPNTVYPKGSVAMAKSTYEPPGTGGSQFFIVTGDSVQLPPDYAVIGKIVEGEDVVEKIGKLGNRETEAPTERVVIESTSVSGD